MPCDRCERAYLYAHSSDELTTKWLDSLRALSERALKGKPTQYITKRQEFYGRDFRVTPDVLIPRPETEHLVEAAFRVFDREPAKRMLDVGTGSGAIAVSVSARDASGTVLACDISPAALAVAERNAREARAYVRFLRRRSGCGGCAAAASICLVSNPPYVPGADAANHAAGGP